MFLQEQKYVNLQIEFAEATDSDERKEIDEKCKEAEKEWKKSKNEYDFIKALSAEKMDASISSTNKITDFKAMDSMQEYKNVESSDTESNEKAEFQLKLQKAKATMQSYAQNFSSLKLQMYQQNDKNIKAKYSKFVIQAEIRWKKSRKEYAILCKEANKFDSINPTVTEYQSLKSRLHEVKKQIQDSKKGIQADSWHLRQ
uniref:Uncharacterized protein n=1 Tax=Panagrolaimus superbus TaxID=310955 RepID=A0A914YHE1_9BILA